ncbi:MAG: 50S ribosomal protein L11 methyltransferase [Kofleriaceae bacterium]
MKRCLPVIGIVAVVVAAACDEVTFADDRQSGPTRKPDVIYVPTPEPVVTKMLTMAKVGPDDVVYDLGCGDGRIPIAAVRDFGAKAGVCVDIDPARIREAQANVKRAGLQDKIQVRYADMFQVDTSPATVVTLYLLDSLNIKLRPKLQRELRNGARIVSQTFSMGDWKPVEHAHVASTPVYLWVISKPEKRDRAASR